MWAVAVGWVHGMCDEVFMHDVCVFVGAVIVVHFPQCLSTTGNAIMQTHSMR